MKASDASPRRNRRSGEDRRLGQLDDAYYAWRDGAESLGAPATHPRPWTYRAKVLGAYWVLDGNGMTVALAETEEGATLIVRAVNGLDAHERLVEAARAVVAWWDADEPDTDYREMAALRAALAEVEEVER